MNAQSWKLAAGCIGLVVALTGCGGGGGGGGGDSPAPSSSSGSGSSGPTPTVPAATALSIGIGTKQLQLSWTAVSGATSYRILEATGLETADGSKFVQIGGELPGTQTTYNRDIAVHLQNWSAARYQVQACNNEGCSTSAEVGAADGALKAIGYFKASNTEAGDTFGWTLALSGDGKTLAVGAPGEASAAKGIDGNQKDNSADQAGAVYVFARSATGWVQQAYLKSSNTRIGDTFGESLALNSDGSTLVVGAPLEDDGALIDAGAAYVFTRSSSSVWGAPVRLTAATKAANAYFGWASTISRDGKTIAIGATGANSDAGAVRVFKDDGGWSEKAVLTASNASSGSNFGNSVALNTSGTVLAVGAPLAGGTGAAYVFSGTSWSQTLIKGDNTAAGDNFGTSVALDGAGTTLAVGAPYNAALSGGAYVFKNESGWTQKAFLQASNIKSGDKDNFGIALALASTGDWLVVGAIGESSAATGIGGNQADNSKDGVGAAYTFALGNSGWKQQAYIKPATSNAGGEFGSTFGFSADTRTLAIGATFEKSKATGIGGDQANTQAADAGAVWLY